MYGELKEYVESLVSGGFEHPFLWETLGDFTIDDTIAVEIYLHAFSVAMGLEETDYQASICMALAERYMNMGDSSIAYRYYEQTLMQSSPMI